MKATPKLQTYEERGEKVLAVIEPDKMISYLLLKQWVNKDRQRREKVHRRSISRDIYWKVVAWLLNSK